MADKLGLLPIPRGDGTKENHGRPTMAWYFRPPRVDDTGNRLTGLPEDCFYTASSWMEHQVTGQTRKAVEVTEGSPSNVILVLDVDNFGGKHNGAPVVAMREFGYGPNGVQSNDSNQRWGRICKMLTEAQKAELAVEKRILAAIEEDLPHVVGQGERNALRERQRVLKERVARLEKGIDFNALKEFFNAEARASQAALRRRDPSQEAYLRKMVDEALDAQGAVVMA